MTCVLLAAKEHHALKWIHYGWLSPLGSTQIWVFPWLWNSLLSFRDKYSLNSIWFHCFTNAMGVTSPAVKNCHQNLPVLTPGCTPHLHNKAKLWVTQNGSQNPFISSTTADEIVPVALAELWSRIRAVFSLASLLDHKMQCEIQIKARALFLKGKIIVHKTLSTFKFYNSNGMLRRAYL